MAKATDQFRASDVTFWAVTALVVWAVAVLVSNASAFIPVGILGGLHASRLDGASLNQLRGQVDDLESRAAELKQENTVLLQRFMLTEQTNGEITRRVGALELTIPKLVEAGNSAQAVDTGDVTAAIGTPATVFAADGGTVTVTQRPLSADGAASSVAPAAQPMPSALGPATPDLGSFGIALGPPIDADEGGSAWQGMSSKVGTLLIGLSPLLASVEGGPGKRLVAGPLATEADARELCGRMAKVGIACASVPFIGDPLATN